MATEAFRPRERTAVSLTPAEMARLEGRYRYRDTGEFTVRAADGRLTLASPGEEPEPAYAASPDELFGSPRTPPSISTEATDRRRAAISSWDKPGCRFSASNSGLAPAATPR